MLKITIPGEEQWDEVNEVFIKGSKDCTLSLEHSLVSISKWESKWHKPYMSDKPKTMEEDIDYIRCMTLTQNVDPEVYKRLTRDNMKEVNDYINDKMTATWFAEKEGGSSSRKIITSEVVYCMMVQLNIPFECQKWHFNRLMTLIRVVGEENTPKKKMGKRDTLNRNRSLNQARRAKSGSKG